MNADIINNTTIRPQTNVYSPPSTGQGSHVCSCCGKSFPRQVGICGTAGLIICPFCGAIKPRKEIIQES